LFYFWKIHAQEYKNNNIMRHEEEGRRQSSVVVHTTTTACGPYDNNGLRSACAFAASDKGHGESESKREFYTDFNARVEGVATGA
jgi:hypothetical protein